MASRLNLHEELCEVLGNRCVYFQPPESIKMRYPGIVYSFEGMDIRNANNRHYKSSNRYTVTLIDPDPDSSLHTAILERFTMCSFDRMFTADNLNHFVYTIYY